MRVWFMPLLICMTAVFGGPLAFAEEEIAGEETEMTAEEFEASIQFRQGEIELPNGVAVLQVPDNFRYVGPEDTERILVEGWGNPEGSGTLGMLFPAGVSILGEEGWGVVITYDEDGYVSDEDAAEIDYDDLLKGLQEDALENNKEREKLGYPPVHLVGWASRPHYDGSAKKLYWAKELRFEGNDVNTLNYNVRVLGRKGVLVMNAVAGMDRLQVVEGGMRQVLAFTDFKPGHRYSDFDPKVDKVAAYGVAALVGGAVASKIGIFAKLGAILLAGKKFVVIGVVALGAFIARLFKRRQVIAEPPDPQNPHDPAA